MKRFVVLSATLLLMGAEAVAQVRPADCRPVFPVVDEVAMAVQPDVVAIQAQPQPIARRRLVGAAFLLPLIAGAGLIAIIASHDDHHRTVSPA